MLETFPVHSCLSGRERSEVQSPPLRSDVVPQLPARSRERCQERGVPHTASVPKANFNSSCSFVSDITIHLITDESEYNARAHPMLA